VSAASPLLVLGLGGVLVLLLDLFWEGRAILLRTAALLVLAAAAAALWAVPGGTAFGGALVLDRWGELTSTLAVAAAAAAVVLPSGRWGRRWSAFEALLLWAAAGMVLLAEAGNLLTVFLGLEALSLALYALTAFDVEDAGAAEAAFKYFLLGGLASGLLLFGAALLFADTGHLDFVAPQTTLGLAGLVLVVAALAFKLALVPFHLWTPDVYEGAPTGVTAFMAVGTKAAALAVLGRIVMAAGPAVPVVAALGVVTLFVGYLMAIPQLGMKRLLAYSSVAHAGTLVLALVVPVIGETVALLYLGAYGAATAGAFAAVAAVESGARGDGLSAFTGLGRRQPVLAFALGVCLLALASVPPTGVFAGKLLLLGTLFGAGHGWLAIAVIVATALSLYPYFKVAYALVAPAEGPAVRVPTGAAVVLGVAVVASVGFGIFPGVLTALHP
jgi:NADH-quinone oxidoreductase subunit N